MSTADDADDEKTRSDPAIARAPRAGESGTDAETGIQAERRRGRASSALQPGHTLPLGTRLRDYEITGLIGEGGFGIVYLAWDHSLQRRVAIKEYMPASMAARVNGSSAIVVKSGRHLDTFRAGLKSFVNEARLLARFDHPSLVKVYRFWEENGTAYMVMPYYEGPTLKAALAGLGRAPREDELRAWLRPLLDALAVMHAAQCYHRDIAPDNILLTPRGPLLLDFGAARRVIGDMTHAITVVLKPGYAPIEQYGDVATMTQGAWTDLYALACVVYYAIAGKTPTSSVERLMDDRLEPLAVSAAGRYSGAFLRAIDAALAVRPGDRPQTEREFRALLDADLPRPPAAPEPAIGTVPFATAPGPLPPEREASASLPSAATARARRRNPAAALLVGSAIVAVIAAAMIFAWQQRRNAVPSGASPAASTIAIPAPASVAAPSLPLPAVASDRTPLSVPASTPVAEPPSPAERSERTPPSAATTSRMPEAAVVVPEAPPVEPGIVERGAPSGLASAPDRTPRPRRDTAGPARADGIAVTPRPAPPREPAIGARCSDILQKASLEPLTAADAAYLKRECR